MISTMHSSKGALAGRQRLEALGTSQLVDTCFNGETDWVERIPRDSA